MAKHLAASLFFALWVFTPNAQAADYYWIVWGTGTGDKGAKPHQWGPDQDSAAAAERLKAEIIKDRTPGGIYAGDPDKPIKLEIVKIRKSDGKRTIEKIPPPDPKVPPAVLRETGRI